MKKVFVFVFVFLQVLPATAALGESLVWEQIPGFSSLPAGAKEGFAQAADFFKPACLDSLKKVETFTNRTLPRALAGANLLKIRADVLQAENFSQLMIHELAHVVDLGHFRGSQDAGESKFRDGHLPIFKNDPSVEFYRISWQDEKFWKRGSSKLDFVTGYAATDPFEDFAESALFFVKHNREFRILAAENEKLAQKFAFMREKVFAGKVFETGKSFADLKVREWDATRI